MKSLPVIDFQLILQSDFLELHQEGRCPVCPFHSLCAQHLALCVAHGGFSTHLLDERMARRSGCGPGMERTFCRWHLLKPACFRWTFPEAEIYLETLQTYGWEKQDEKSPHYKNGGMNFAAFQRNQTKSLKIECGTVIFNRYCFYSRVSEVLTLSIF